MYEHKRTMYSPNTSFLISKTCLNVIVYCVVFILQMLIFGFLPIFRYWYVGDILVSAVVFAITSLFFVIKFVKITKS